LDKSFDNEVKHRLSKTIVSLKSVFRRSNALFVIAVIIVSAAASGCGGSKQIVSESPKIQSTAASSNIDSKPNDNETAAAQPGAAAQDKDSPTGISVLEVIYNAILNSEKTCDISAYQISDKNLDEACDIWQLLEDNPLIEYITNYTSYSINGIISEIEFDYMEIPDDYFERMELALISAAADIKKNLQDDYLQSELACAISDYIVTHCEYALESDGETPDSNGTNNAYAALVEGRAVCDGYASAFTMLAQEFGLPVLEVAGLSEPGGVEHAWNLVNIDGVWYHVDTTWNDPTPDEPGYAGHNYLLLSDEAMASYHGADHYHSEWEAGLPEAADKRYEDAFWVYEFEPISFAEMHFDEWSEAVTQTTFQDIIISAVENDTEAKVARFGYSEDEFHDAVRSIYPNIGYSYIIDANGTVISADNWDR